VVSTAEGDDKPAKYPMLFRDSKAVILNKTDLMPYTNFNFKSFRDDLTKINPSVPLFEMSCTKGDGLDAWFSWLTKQIP
jgi:hydrogenase nickel incorporation protein HypB